MNYELLSSLYYQNTERYQAEYKARWESTYAVHLSFKIGEFSAFFLQTPEINQKLVDILRMDKAITNLRTALPGIAVKQFTQRCLVDEIYLTNSIEGVRSTRKEIGELLNDLSENNKNKRFYGLVKKYEMLSIGAELPLETCMDIRHIYDELVLPEVVSDDPKNQPDGEIFRRDISRLYSPTQKVIHSGLYPEQSIVSAMEEALSFLNESKCEILYKIAVFHYLLEYIHPFYDGNGRLGRFIASYLLSQHLEPIAGYRLSYTIKEQINSYYKAFDICNKETNLGDLTPFVAMFMDVLWNSMDKLQQSLEEGFILLNRSRAMLDSIGIAEKHRWLYDVLVQAALFSEDGITINELMTVGELSRGTVDGLLKSISTPLLVKKRVRSTNYYTLNLHELGIFTQQKNRGE